MLHRFAIVAFCVACPSSWPRPMPKPRGDGKGRFTMTPSKVASCASTKRQASWRCARTAKRKVVCDPVDDRARLKPASLPSSKPKIAR